MSDAAAVATPPEVTTIQPASAPAPETTTPSGNEPAAETSLLSEAAKEPTEGEKIQEAPAPELFDPEKISFPDGMKKDDELFKDFANIATEHKLTAPVAQAFIDLAAKQVQAAAQRQMAEWATQNESWQAEVRADKEIGGDKLERSLQTFSKVASDPALSDPRLREALAHTGAGNHPAIVRTLVKWAAALSEGGAVRGNPANGNRPPETLGQAIYGQNGPHVGGPKFS